ncbi:MAG: hypothetical protein COB77_02650 [Gammaproteobacteria bacterium]|nr:MAG: hypothetical protein COB77_02650 [Gammaproteobacteria bacterium]
MLITGKQPKSKKIQEGLALLVLIIILALALISYSLSQLSIVQIQTDQVEKTQIVLKKARDALIAHAITNSYRVANVGRVGNLPCPDGNNAGTEGNQDPNCGNLDTNTIGYFPWKSMGINILKDPSGACLLYAVSPSYKMNNARMLNADSNGLFQIVNMAGGVIEGNLPGDRPVAIIFATNEPVAAQARSFDVATICGKDFGNLDAYLDNNGVVNNGVLSGNPNTIDQFVHATSTSENNANPLNDIFVTIKKSDIWSAILAKTNIEEKLAEVAEALAVCLADYANANTYRQLPWPASLDLSASVDSYFFDSNYVDVNAAAQGYAGRYPYDIGNSNPVVIGSAWPDNILTAPACSNIDLPSTPAPTIEAIDLRPTGEHGIIWHNWKDHFYYALSNNYEPNNGAILDSICNGANGCVSVNGVANEYAAIVFYSGESINGVTRTSPEVAGDPNQKAVIANYIENNNQLDFPDLVGENDYQSGLIGNNDFMFCVTNELAGINLRVVSC